MPNKIQYGLKNVHYAKLTETVNSLGVTSYSYGTVKVWPGAVSLSLDPQGDLLKEYADDSEWYTQAVNNGYEGDLEYEVMPDDFRENILGDTKDTNGVYLETDDVSTNYFAFLFEINGDAKKRRNVFYKCSSTREQNENETKGENITPTHVKITITAVPRGDHKVKASTGDNTGTTTYNNWFSEVYDGPTATS